MAKTRAEYAAAERARQARLNEAGLCCSCAKSPLSSHPRYCDDCLARRREREARNCRAQRARWKAAGLCTNCGKAPAAPDKTKCHPCFVKLSEYHKQHRERLLDYYRERGRQKAAALRAEVLAAYGGVCVCCGEVQQEFLSIDHINGGGNAERRQYGGGTAFYRHLKRAGYPKDGYRTLCHNCNLSRGFFGYCPHELSNDAHSRPETSSA